MTPNEVLFHYSQYHSVHTLEIQTHLKANQSPISSDLSTDLSGLVEMRSETESERRERDLSCISSEANPDKLVSSSLAVVHPRIDQYPVYDDIIRDRHRSMFSNT